VARDGLLRALAVSHGDAAGAEFDRCLQTLRDNYVVVVPSYNHINQGHTAQARGTWLALTRPTFFDCLGENGAGDPMYTLGRMSFDMFSPGDLICSLQGNFNQVEAVAGDTQDHRAALLASVPKSLRREVGDCATVLSTYKYVLVSLFFWSRRLLLVLLFLHC
jgi:hypothetical protein